MSRKHYFFGLFSLLTAHCSLLTSSIWAQNPSLVDDYTHITEWLSSELVEGLAFHPGASFSPPTEPRPYAFEIDASMALGLLPSNLDKFPKLGVVKLEELGVKSYFPASVPYGTLNTHVRMGLPQRMDFAVKLGNLTTPTMPLSSQTKGKGQSNKIGGEVRKHFYGQENPFGLTAAIAADYFFGHFDFFNRFSDVKMTDTFTTSANNSGIVQWKMASYGANLLGSYRVGTWLPFFGLGVSHTGGSALVRMRSEFETDLINPIEGESSASPRGDTLRILFGTQYFLRRSSLFFSGEVLTIGHSAGKIFNLNAGIIFPLGGGKSYYGQEVRKIERSDKDSKTRSGLLFIR